MAQKNTYGMPTSLDDDPEAEARRNTIAYMPPTVPGFASQNDIEKSESLADVDYQAESGTAPPAAPVEAPKTPQAAPAPPPQQELPPVDMRAFSASDTTTSQIKPTEEAKAAIVEAKDASSKLADTATAAGEVQANKAAEIAKLDRQQQDDEVARQFVTMERQQAAQKKQAEADDYLKKQRDAVANAPAITDYWADKSTGSKVMAAIMAGVGQYAAVMSGTRNTALDIINGAIERDYRLKKDQQEKSKYMVQLAREDSQAAMQQRQLLDIELRNEAIGAREWAARQTEIVARKYGSDEARAQAATQAQGLRATNAKEERSLQLQLSPQIQSSNANAHAAQRQLAAGEIAARQQAAQGAPPDPLAINDAFGNKIGRANSESGAAKLADQAQDYAELRDAITQMEASVKVHQRLYDGAGGKLLNSKAEKDEIKKREGLYSRIKAGLRKNEALRMSAGLPADAKQADDVLDAQIGNTYTKGTVPFLSWDGDPTIKLKTLKDSLSTGRARALSAYGSGINGNVAIEAENRAIDARTAQSTPQPKEKITAGKLAQWNLFIRDNPTDPRTPQFRRLIAASRGAE